MYQRREGVTREEKLGCTREGRYQRREYQRREPEKGGTREGSLKEVEVAVRRTQAQGHEVMLELTGYGNSEALVVVGYAHFQWGIEHLAREIFRGRSNGDQDSVRMLQELLLRSEVLAEPRPVFREILKLAKKDAEYATAPTALNDRLLGKRYLEFFAYLRPNDPFDGMVFQAFVKADQCLPKERVAQYRIVHHLFCKFRNW